MSSSRRKIWHKVWCPKESTASVCAWQGAPGNKNERTRGSGADQKGRRTRVPVAQAPLHLKQLLFPVTAAIHLRYLWQIVWVTNRISQPTANLWAIKPTPFNYKVITSQGCCKVWSTDIYRAIWDPEMKVTIKGYRFFIMFIDHLLRPEAFTFNIPWASYQSDISTGIS